MSKRHVAVGASLLGLVAAGALSFSPGAANADIAPQAKDVVGVGSDVIQNSVNFLADGSPFADPGYNSAGNLYRVFDFDASPDANGRAAFADPSLTSGAVTLGADGTQGTKVTGTGVPLRASSVLAAGESPQERPNGGGAGLAAILADTSDNVDFVRDPNLPTQTDESTAGGADGKSGTLGTYLDAIQFADDAQYVATASTTNAPTGLTGEALAAIYCTKFSSAVAHDGLPDHIKYWGDIPGYQGPGQALSGTAQNPTYQTADYQIQAERPQDGAGVLTVFQTAIGQYATDGCKAWNTASATTTAVTQVQQNDPTTIAGNPNAIVVFPLSRFKLLQQGYYPDTTDSSWTVKNGFPANKADGTASTPAQASGIRLQIPTGKPGNTTGNQLTSGSFTPVAAGAGYYADLPFYILFRDSDAVSQTPWQPGSTLNWVQTLFYNEDYNATNPSASGVPAPFFASAAGKQLITNLGLTPKYVPLPGGAGGITPAG